MYPQDQARNVHRSTKNAKEEYDMTMGLSVGMLWHRVSGDAGSHRGDERFRDPAFKPHE